MIRTLLVSLFVAVLSIGALGCGGAGSGDKKNNGPALADKNVVDEAKAAQQEGRKLTGKQKRVLGDAAAPTNEK